MRALAFILSSHRRLTVVIMLSVAVAMVTYSVYLKDNNSTASYTSLHERNSSDDTISQSTTHGVAKAGGLHEWNLWPDSKASSHAITRTTEQVRVLEQYVHTFVTVRKPKSILLFGDFFFDFAEAQRAFVDDRCPITECTLTLDADQYRRTADAIIILNMDATTLKKFLPKPAHQVWIANHWESPVHNLIDTVAMGPYVNWSSSYRHDSHIVTPYGYVEPLPASSVDKSATLVDYAAGKTKQVAWFASNCNDKNGRKNYAYELSRYVTVDIYGKCGLGALQCPRTSESLCFEWLEKDYKFYLAFENSNCHYYITEKLFTNALRHNVIPIVMGARHQDYAKALPPHSYIHVDDFRSPRDLADYLHVLDANDTLYNEYFRWKTEYTLTGYSYWCRLCGLLHVASEQRYVHWYTDYSQWWDGVQGSACGSKWTSYNGVSWRTWNV